MHYYISLQCKANNLAATLSTALRKSGIDIEEGLVIRSDNGPQMTSKMFYRYLIDEVKHKVEHEFIPRSTLNKNAHVKYFYSIIESEFIPLYYFIDLNDVRKKFDHFMEFYNNIRVHGSLQGKSPSEIMGLDRLGKLANNIKEAHI
jgi:putative transposase